jgi:hypothetical protein
MSDYTMVRIALASLLVIFGLLMGLCLELNTVWLYLTVAPLAVVCLAVGFDWRDSLLARVKKSENAERNLIVNLLLSIVVIPIPATAVLWVLTLVFGKIGGVDGLFEAWRHSCSMLIVYCLLWGASGNGSKRFMSVGDWLRDLRAAKARDAEK